MIKNLLDSVEENFNAAIIIMLFLGAVAGGVSCLANGLSSDKRDIEMAKLGCSQELVSTSVPHYNHYIIWKCPDATNK